MPVGNLSDAAVEFTSSLNNARIPSYGGSGYLTEAPLRLWHVTAPWAVLSWCVSW